MANTATGDTIAPMTDDRVERGQRIDAARAELGLKPTRLYRMANMSRDTYYRAIKGTAGPDAYAALEQALADAREHPEDIAENPVAIVPGPEGLIEVEIDPNTSRVIVRGPVTNAEELKRFASELLRDLRQNPRDTSE